MLNLDSSLHVSCNLFMRQIYLSKCVNMFIFLYEIRMLSMKSQLTTFTNTRNTVAGRRQSHVLFCFSCHMVQHVYHDACALVHTLTTFHVRLRLFFPPQWAVVFFLNLPVMRCRSPTDAARHAAPFLQQTNQTVAHTDNTTVWPTFFVG